MIIIVNNRLCLTRVAHNSLATDKPVALEFPIELEFRSVGYQGVRKTGDTGEKPPEQQTQPTYDVGSGNRTQATLVGSECSHHCAIPAPTLACWRRDQ